MSVPDSILTLVRSPIPNVDVFDSGAPDEDESVDIPERYAVYWPDIGTPQGGNVAGEFTGGLFRFQVNSVAPDRGMAEWIAAKIRGALVGVSPFIPGWQCGQILLPISLPARRDESILSRRLVVVTDRYELLAEQQ